jgi:MFS family permease
MLRQMRLMFGISIFWLALSMLFDGINTLILPLQLSELADQKTQATVLGLLTFIGLLTGALVQPVAGELSDRLQPLIGRKGFIRVL